MPKKIALVLAQPPAYSETFFNSKIKGLQAHGYTVTLYVGKANSKFKLCKVVVAPKVSKQLFIQLLRSFCICITLLFHLKAVRKFIQLEHGSKSRWTQVFKRLYLNSHLLKARADWVHFGFATLALQREHVAKAIGAKLAVSLRGFDIAIYPLKHNNCYHTLWPQVDKVHVISDDLLALAYKEGLPNTTPFTKITPAIDAHFFSCSNSIKDGKVTELLTVGRLHWKKGLVTTLEALAFVKAKGIAFKYKIIGDGSEREALLFAIHQLGLEAEVEVLPAVSPKVVAEYMQKADVYLQYSVQEGFCNAVLEAQASGCLCIVSDAEGLPENVIHGETGWVVPKRSPHLLATCIKTVVNLEFLEKEQFQKRARMRIEDAFTLAQQQKAFVEFYTV
ncbi:glycosyltransferase family 4 protein [Lacinutrix undariae]